MCIQRNVGIVNVIICACVCARFRGVVMVAQHARAVVDAAVASVKEQKQGSRVDGCWCCLLSFRRQGEQKMGRFTSLYGNMWRRRGVVVDVDGD